MKKNGIIVGLLVIAIVVVVGIRNKTKGGAAFDDTPISLAGNSPSDVREKKLPKLFDLGSGKCIPCKTMAPILDEMKETFKGQFDVEFIDVWENEAAGRQYGIRMIPTQIYFDAEGKEVFRHEGFYAREDMLAKWSELGFAFADDGE